MFGEIHYKAPKKTQAANEKDAQGHGSNKKNEAQAQRSDKEANDAHEAAKVTSGYHSNAYSASQKAHEASAKAWRSGDNKDHKEAMQKHMIATRQWGTNVEDPNQAKYHNTLALDHMHAQNEK